jgi:hypothetical protein
MGVPVPSQSRYPPFFEEFGHFASLQRLRSVTFSLADHTFATQHNRSLHYFVARVAGSRVPDP